MNTFMRDVHHRSQTIMGLLAPKDFRLFGFPIF